jgi:outer membrane lipoprotein SlyB
MRTYNNQQINFTVMLIVFCFLLIGCAGPKPILYPNTHFKSVGQEQADKDIAECKAFAEQYASTSEGGKRMVKSTAMGAGVGAASGAVGGAIRGSASQGSLVGAAAGATIGLIRGLFTLNEPNHTYMTLVNRCLSDRGYESVGWD